MTWLKYVIGGAIIVVAVILLQMCEGEQQPTAPTVYIVRKDSIQVKVLYKDSIRIKYVDRWHTLKPRLDSIPCPEALAETIVLTDSIIMVDSSEISSLKAEILIDNLIIDNQAEQIKQDSAKIHKLKRHRRILAGIAVALGVIAAVK